MVPSIQPENRSSLPPHIHGQALPACVAHPGQWTWPPFPQKPTSLFLFYVVMSQDQN